MRERRETEGRRKIEKGIYEKGDRRREEKRDRGGKWKLNLVCN